MSRHFRKDEEGNAIVEFALLLPIYAILIFGAYFIGEACLVRHQLRSDARTLSYTAGGSELASIIKDVLEDELARFSLGLPRNPAKPRYETPDPPVQYIEVEGGGMVNYRDNAYLRSCLATAIQNGAGAAGVDYDISNVLSGNYHYDWVTNGYRGHMLSYSRYRVAAPAKMVFATESTDVSSPGDSDYYDDLLPPDEMEPDRQSQPYAAKPPTGDFYFDYFFARSEHLLIKGGTVGIAIPSDALQYTHPVEPVVTEKFGDSGGAGGRMPDPRHLVLIPSDRVLGPRYFPFSWQRQQAPRGPTP